MYAAKKTLYISRESISYWNNGTKFTWTDSVISEFNSRMHGKTVEQELEMIGYEKSNDRDKLVLDIDWDKTYCFFFYDYELDLDYAPLNESSIQRKNLEDDCKSDFSDLTRYDCICFKIS